MTQNKTGENLLIEYSLVPQKKSNQLACFLVFPPCNLFDQLACNRFNKLNLHPTAAQSHLMPWHLSVIWQPCVGHARDQSLMQLMWERESVKREAECAGVALGVTTTLRQRQRDQDGRWQQKRDKGEREIDSDILGLDVRRWVWEARGEEGNVTANL